MNRESLEAALAFYRQRGLVTGRVNLDDVVDAQYAAYALGKLGRAR